MFGFDERLTCLVLDQYPGFSGRFAIFFTVLKIALRLPFAKSMQNKTSLERGQDGNTHPYGYHEHPSLNIALGLGMKFMRLACAQERS